MAYSPESRILHNISSHNPFCSTPAHADRILPDPYLPGDCQVLPAPEDIPGPPAFSALKLIPVGIFQNFFKIKLNISEFIVPYRPQCIRRAIILRGTDDHRYRMLSLLHLFQQNKSCLFIFLFSFRQWIVHVCNNQIRFACLQIFP